MKDKKLKVNSKYYGIKTTLVGASIGTSAILGCFTFVNVMYTHQISPFFDPNYKVEGHKIISHIYSKDGEEVINDYSADKEYDKLFGMKYYDDYKKTDACSFWNVSNLTEDKLHYIYSYIDKTNKYDLEVIRGFLYDNASKINLRSSDLLKARYFKSNDSYGLKYIKSEEDMKDTKMIPGINKDLAILLNFLSCWGSCLGGILGAFAGHSYGEQKKKYLNK